MLKFILLLGLFGGMSMSVCADDAWEYKVVILQGVTAGGKIENISKGISVDTQKTKALNELAADDWQVVSVVGELVADHVVYLRRKVAPQ